MFTQTLLWGTVVGVIHFMIVGMLYGNPFVDRIYQAAMQTEPGVRKWPSRGAYLLTQFLGTQIEVYIVALAYFFVRPLMPESSVAPTLTVGLLLAGVRVYPRFWNMFIQSTYPRRLLAIEFVNGVISTLTIVVGLSWFTS